MDPPAEDLLDLMWVIEDPLTRNVEAYTWPGVVEVAARAAAGWRSHGTTAGWTLPLMATAGLVGRRRGVWMFCGSPTIV